MKLNFVSFFVSLLAFGQPEYPKDYFKSPLDIPMELSGNFGELRNNHFHSGFDLKTNKVEGLPVYAAADGYVSRIKISNFGYGKAIYITHPNGFTSVYGHLQKGNGEIENFIKQNQYAQKSFEIELFPLANQLIVKKGEQIAFSGNTGGSGGPHLHFEIRDTSTEKIINPMFFGFNAMFPDAKPPTVQSIVLYPLGEESVVNRSNQPILANLTLLKDGTFIADKIKLKGKMGIGINTFDMFDHGYNKYGIFKIDMFHNGIDKFGFCFDTFAFDEFRYVNALIDYPRFVTMKQRVQKLFMQNPYPLSIIKKDETSGIIEMNSPNTVQIYRIEVADFMNNKTIITVPVEYGSAPAINIKNKTRSKYHVIANLDSNFEDQNVEVFFPAKTFYEDFYMDFEVKNDTIKIHNETIPVHSNFILTIKDNKHKNSELEKVALYKIEGKKLEYIYSKRKDSVFKAYTRELGSFVLKKDTVAPIIKPLKNIEGNWMSNDTKIQIIIADELSGIKDYQGFINDEWVLFEYDYKTKMITYNFEDKRTIDGKNNLKVVVNDNVGNSAIFETFFYRSQK